MATVLRSAPAEAGATSTPARARGVRRPGILALVVAVVIALTASQPLPVLVALTVVAVVAATAIGVHHLAVVRSRGARDRRWSGPAGRARRARRTAAARAAAVPAAPPVAPPPSNGVPAVDPAEAEEFLALFHAENPAFGPAAPRIAAVLREIEATGSYRHTADELVFGARVAWRNNARCIGRLYWRSLQVRDLRTVADASGVAAQCFEHLRVADHGGRIRPMITIFAPETPTGLAPRIWSEQLIRYAGYLQADGTILGDPRNHRLTSELERRGWRPPEPRGAFDVLPLVVETAEEGVRVFRLPADAVREVEIEHPELAWFADLGLRWHAVPVISNQRLVIGGVSYPAAPFNGWYMGTEIGARNFADTERYDLVPTVAARMGLDTSCESTLWRDQALVELNRAVLHSFARDGVTITDHHTESQRFLTHLGKEEKAGRRCPADWSWIVPPLSGSQTPVFHRYYDTDELTPNFFVDPDATHRALAGGPPAFG